MTYWRIEILTDAGWQWFAQIVATDYADARRTWLEWCEALPGESTRLVRA